MSIDSQLYQSALEHTTVDALDWEQSIEVAGSQFKDRTIHSERESEDILRFIDTYVSDRNRRIAFFRKREDIILNYTFGHFPLEFAAKELLPIELFGRNSFTYESQHASRRLVAARSRLFQQIIEKSGCDINMPDGVKNAFHSINAFCIMYRQIINASFDVYCASLTNTHCPSLDQAGRSLYKYAAQDFLKRKVEEFFVHQYAQNS